MHIILDLDETCINSVENNKNVIDASKFEKFNTLGYTTYIRPHLKEFIDWALKHCSVSIWSAGEKTYVFDIVKNLFPDQKINLLLWRDHCDKCNDDTGMLKNIDWLNKKIPGLEKYGNILLIDDLKDNCTLNGSNAFNISSFDVSNHGADIDTAFLDLKNNLENIHNGAVEVSNKFWSL